MPAGPEIRTSRVPDPSALSALYHAGFPDEDLLPLVRRLLHEDATVLSLVATCDGSLAGHVLFTACGIEGCDDRAALLGPLVVAPKRQRQGIGQALVRTGLGLLWQAGPTLVCVLGDPAYYGRLGFAAETAVAPPCPLPPAWRPAWQSRRSRGDEPPRSGRLLVPGPWRDPALWTP